jgi:hypothetical protein
MEMQKEPSVEQPKRDVSAVSGPFDTSRELSRFQNLPDQAMNCLRDLYKLLAPPFMHDIQLRDRAWRQLLQEMIDKLNTLIPESPAVSVFLVSDDGKRLDCVAGSGYKPESAYNRTAYSTQSNKFTTIDVFASHAKRPAGISMTRKQLDRGEIHFSGKCDDALPSKLTRLIAIPVALPAKKDVQLTQRHGEKAAIQIAFPPSKCFGVLKIEGWTGDNDTPFLKADVELARVFASTIATACQLRLYWQLWDKGKQTIHETRSRLHFVERITQVLASGLNAECSSIFLSHSENDPANVEYRFAAGVGYSDEATMPSARKEFIQFVTGRQTPRMFNDPSEVPEFSVNWDSCFESGKFRNSIVVPLLDRENALSTGLLLLENKLPNGSPFDALDLELCVAFAEEIVERTLQRYRPKGDSNTSSSPGYRQLVNSIGVASDADLDSVNLPKTVKRVREAQDASPTLVTVEDCVRYLKISRARYYRLINSGGTPGSKRGGTRAGGRRAASPSPGNRNRR